MSMMETAGDVQRTINTISKNANLDVRTKAELVNNILPLLMATLESVDERFRELEGVVSELAGADDGTLPEAVLVALQAAFTAADAVCIAAMESVPEGDAKVLLTKLVTEYKTAVEAAAEKLAEVPEDEGDDEDDTDDDSEDGEDE